MAPIFCDKWAPLQCCADQTWTEMCTHANRVCIGAHLSITACKCVGGHKTSDDGCTPRGADDGSITACRRYKIKCTQKPPCYHWCAPVSVIQLLLWSIHVQPAFHSKSVREYPHNQQINLRQILTKFDNQKCLFMYSTSPDVVHKKPWHHLSTHFQRDILPNFSQKKHLKPQTLGCHCTCQT